MNDLPEGKKFEAIPNDPEEPYDEYCKCGHEDFYHPIKSSYLFRAKRVNCKKCKCPKFTSLGILGWNQAQEFKKKLGVND